MGRRAAAFTQDELVRALRAAEKTGFALEIEGGKMRLTPQPEQAAKPPLAPAAVAKNSAFRF